MTDFDFFTRYVAGSTDRQKKLLSQTITKLRCKLAQPNKWKIFGGLIALDISEGG